MAIPGMDTAYNASESDLFSANGFDNDIGMWIFSANARS